MILFIIHPFRILIPLLCLILSLKSQDLSFKIYHKSQIEILDASMGYALLYNVGYILYLSSSKGGEPNLPNR